MSRAFVKDDAAGGELRFTARPPLPDGEPNYVTKRGLALLEAERQQYVANIAALAGTPDSETKIAEERLSLQELELRIADAVLVELPPLTPTTTARIGHVLTVVFGPNDEDEIVITGVDEADPAQGYVSFGSPLAQALLGKRAGETGTYYVGDEPRTVTLVSVQLPPEVTAEAPRQRAPRRE